ncbi:MAG: HAD-superfamily hydrolase subfamily variant 3 [Proteobacteria bacterium]|nr:HAD-superfamily hydrolase subfamily variant 3 [Pseudomonadota bacterium]
MNALQALIFDVDGTLAETERDGHRHAFNAAFAELGLNWYWDETRYGHLLAITGGKERMRHYAAQCAPEIASRPDIDALIRQLHAAKTAHYVRLVGEGRLSLRSGVAELIAEARAGGIRLAIASTTSSENITALLDASLAPGSADWFEVIGAGDVVAAKKPASDIYHWVLERLALPTSACLAIEDSENGLRAAQGAGLRCLVTVSEYSREQDFSGAAMLVDTLAGTSLSCLAPCQDSKG